MTKRHTHPVQFAILLVAIAVMALLAWSPARAANGDAMLIGVTTNASTAATTLTNSASGGLKVTGFNMNGQYGLWGTTSNGGGYGVIGDLNGGGVGVLARQVSTAATSGPALMVSGRLDLGGRAALTTTNDASVDSEEEVLITDFSSHGVHTDTIAFATMAAPAGGTIWVVGVTMDPGSEKIRVRFNAPVANGTAFFFMLVDQ
jgi:hypothetical protein